MTDNQNQQIVSILMDIKSELGEQRGLLKSMHEKQDYTTERVTDSEKRINVLEVEQREVKVKVGLFGLLAGSVGSVLMGLIKGKLGI